VDGDISEATLSFWFPFFKKKENKKEKEHLGGVCIRKLNHGGSTVARAGS